MRFKHALFCAWLRFTAGKCLREYSGDSQIITGPWKDLQCVMWTSDERMNRSLHYPKTFKIRVNKKVIVESIFFQEEMK